MKLSIIQPVNELNTIIKRYIVVTSLEDNANLWFLPNAGNYINFNPIIKGHVCKYNSDSEKFPISTDFNIGIKANDILKFEVSHEETVQELPYPIIIVELQPTGFHRLFGQSAHDLRDKSLLLTECLKDSHISFENLYQQPSVEEQIAFLEDKFIQLKDEPHPTLSLSTLFNEITHYINRTLQEVNVSDILKEFSYSRSSLERDFKKVIGFTPKEFIQISRFNVIFRDLIVNGYDYMQLEYNYFDQSHLNKAFKKFIDIPPSKLQAYVQDNDIKIYQMHPDYQVQSLT